MRLMGIDYGEKRIGLAVSDEAGNFAFAHSVVENCPTCWGGVLEKIKKIAQEKKIEKIILGESVDYKGEPNPIMNKIELFKTKIEDELGLLVIYQSETLTTSESLRDPGRTGPRGNVSNKRKVFKMDKNDASAAALILRSYIEKQLARNAKYGIASDINSLSVCQDRSTYNVKHSDACPPASLRKLVKRCGRAGKC